MQLLLIDDHVMFRQGLKFLLSDLDESLQFMESGSCEKAVEILATETCDLILLDLNMPGVNGLSALRMILAAAPQVPVAVLSGETGSNLIRAAIDEGASGFVPKSSSSELLVAALQLICRSPIWISAWSRLISIWARSNSISVQVDKSGWKLSAVFLTGAVTVSAAGR